MVNSSNIIGAFSVDHVVRLTSLSRGQLSYWDKTGFFSPQYASENTRDPYSRVYSFRDVVGLRTIAILRKDYRVSLPRLRKTASDLAAKGYESWAELELYVLNREVHFRAPGTDYVEGVSSGQVAMLPIIDVINDVSERLEKLRKRSHSQIGKVEKHRFVARNATVVAGTRIPTATIRRYAEAGFSIEQILREYPTLNRKDVKAALSHEERLARSA